MNNNTKKTENKSRRKWPWILLFCIIGLIGLARLALLTAPVQRWVKNTIVDTVNKQLKPQLSIENLSGDLWNSATLTHVVLTEDSTVASIDTLHLQYSPLSYFSDAFEIHEIRIANPFIKIEEQDSTLNVQNWITSTDTSGGAFAVSISNLLIEGGRLDVSMPQTLPDSSFIIDDLNIAGSIGYFGDRYDARIADFNFDIKNTRLDSVVSFAATADADESSITLEKLVIATGNSLLNVSGRANLVDSTANFDAKAKPLGWKDIAAYMDSVPVPKNINMSLALSGNSNAFDVNLHANAEGIEAFSVISSFERDSAITLTSFRASADRMDLATFMSDTSMPQLQNLEFQAQGRVPLDQYQQSKMEGTLSAAQIRQGQYQVDTLQGSFTLENSEAKIRLEPVKAGQRLIANAELSQIWSNEPSVSLSFQGNNINPEIWLPDQGYSGSLTFKGEVSGTGWFPDKNFWNYALTVNQSRLMGQSVDQANFSGRFNGQRVTNQSKITIAQSKLRLQAEVRQLQSVPEFSYTLNVNDVNLADFPGLEEYPSFITATAKGNGQGSSLDNLSMQTSVEMDSSIFKGETIQNLRANAQIRNSVLTITDAKLKSSIADGNLNGRFHLQDFYDAENSLDLNLQLKDLSSFASVANVEILQATGSVNGTLKPVTKDSLVFNGRIDLKNLNYNNQFVAQNVDGDVRVEFEEQPKYVVDIDISDPTVATTDLQNIALKTEGQMTDLATAGSFEITLTGADKGSIGQAGTYNIAQDTTSVELTAFELKSSIRTLSLQKPIHAFYANGALQTDTLHLSTKDGSAFVELAVPYADTLRQKAYMKAEKLNLTVIQNAIFDKAYFEGTLFGALNVDRTDTSLVASGDITMTKLLYEETQLDTLQFETNIENERLTGVMELHQQGELIAEGDIDIPFKLENPDQLDESFFEKPVSGHLVLHALKLERFNTLLEQMGYENTKGIVQFDGSLEGQAGQPQIDARLSLTKAVLSGVPIDSLIASANYRHNESNLNLNATLTSLKQRAFEVDARMPLQVDLKNLDIAMPGGQDSISVDIATNDFNLKALNDFVPRTTARNLEGLINGSVKIRGPRSDLQTEGKITLQKGAVRVVSAGIRLDHIELTVQFKPDKIVLSNLRMESGKGRLNAKGELALEQLVPGDIDVTITAKNFKAANTDEYNALIDLNLRVDGSVTKPNVSGKLEVINGFIELDNFGEKSVEQVRLDTTLAPETQISVYDSLSLDMDIEFNRRFFVRNQRYLELEIELDGQIDLLKDAGEDLEMFGTLNTVNGYARPLGKRFELEEGSLAFSGPPDNPQVNIRTLFTPPQADQEIKIWYIIEGTVEDPQFKYESQPPMDLAGIISYTLFGQPFYKLNPAEQSVASSSSNNAAADFAIEVLLDRVESLATKRLGIDVVRIEQTRQGGESGTSVTTGWYINPKVFFAIQNVITGSTPTTGFFLEYYLQENLKLILSQGNDNRQGVDVQWEYDY